MTEKNTSVPTRNSGALTTRLNTALERARDALRPHEKHVSGGSLAELEEMLAEFERRRVRIALYGEVKAGKSTLLNAIAGAVLSPAAFEPLTSIPVHVTYGDSTFWSVGERQVDNADEIARLMRTDEPGANRVVVHTNLDLLQLGGQVDLIDTPGVGSEERFDAITGEVLRSLDAVVLVVRYPGLFTQATRRLMNGLQTDMGKLFVVWNLDQACADLAPSEKAHNTETLRANVAGAHDLFLVDARTGFDAVRRRDATAIAASGLGTFTAALTRFLSSSGRDLAAVREACKRALRFVGAAQRLLGERHTELKDALAKAKERLRAVQESADADTRAARSRLQEFEQFVAKLAEDHNAGSFERAQGLRRRLRQARRRWIRDGNATALAESSAVAAADYAEAAAAASSQTTDRLLAESEGYGAIASLAPRPRTPLEVGSLAPEERLRQAEIGNLRLVRRALWRRWYLPGVERLLGTNLNEDLAAEAAWLENAVTAVRAAATQTLQSRVAEISARCDAEQEQIKQETNFSASEAEFENLSTNLPIIDEELKKMSQIAVEARSFL